MKVSAVVYCTLPVLVAVVRLLISGTVQEWTLISQDCTLMILVPTVATKLLSLLLVQVNVETSLCCKC